MRVVPKWGIYSRIGAHPVAQAFAAGLEGIGHAARHRSHSDYKGGETEGFDYVAIFGLRGMGRRIAKDYEAKDVPVIVADFGYLSRTSGESNAMSGHWQVGIGGLNSLPPFACPPDRFEALGLTLMPPVERDGPRVLCLQIVGDAAHPFDTPEKLAAFVKRVPHDEIRAHPGAAPAPRESLQAMLARAGTVITWNSNIGHDALLAGVPVEAHGDAPYKDVAMADRGSYFARVAYGQWTAAEMREGLPQRFLAEHWLPGKPLEMPAAPAPAEPVVAPETLPAIGPPETHPEARRELLGQPAHSTRDAYRHRSRRR